MIIRSILLRQLFSFLIAVVIGVARFHFYHYFTRLSIVPMDQMIDSDKKNPRHEIITYKK